MLLWWVLRGTDLHLLWANLRKASLLSLGAAGFVGLAHNVFRVLRWRALLEPVRANVPFGPMFIVVILGYTTSWVIPGRLGELVRPALLAGRQKLPLGLCLGSVLADRLLDIVAVLGLFAVGLVVTPLAPSSADHTLLIRGSALVLAALMGLPILVLMIAARHRAWFERRLVHRRGLLGLFWRLLLSLAQGAQVLQHPVLLVRIVCHTALAWLLIASSTWIGIRSCGVQISFGGVLVLMPLLVLDIALPTPGGVGGYHAFMRVGLVQLFAVSEAQAVGAGLMQYAAIVLPIILLGGLILVVDRVPIHDFVQAARQARHLVADQQPPAPSGEGVGKI